MRRATEAVDAFVDSHAIAIQTPLDAYAVLVYASAVSHQLADARAPLAKPWASSDTSHTLHLAHGQRAYRLKLTALDQNVLATAYAVDASRPQQRSIHTEWSSAAHLTDAPWPYKRDEGPLSRRFADVDALLAQCDRELWSPLLGIHTHTASPATAPSQPMSDRRPAQATHWPSSTPPLRIGDADRDPLAASPNIFTPGMGSIQPPPLFGGARRGDGMVVGPDHPMFERPPNAPPAWPPMGPDGVLPPDAAPPGARFDPIMPWATDPRRGNPRFSGDPDFDDLAPPPGGMYS